VPGRCYRDMDGEGAGGVPEIWRCVEAGRSYKDMEGCRSRERLH